MCVALTMIEKEEDFHDELEADADLSHGKNKMQMKFSYQVAWVMIKPSRSGHIVKINCGGKSQKYLSRKGGIQHCRYKIVQYYCSNPNFSIFFCEDAVLKVLMYVCLSVRNQVEILPFKAAL